MVGFLKWCYLVMYVVGIGGLILGFFTEDEEIMFYAVLTLIVVGAINLGAELFVFNKRK